MHTSPIQMIRNAGIFIRSISAIVVVTFSMLILTPTAMAAQQAYKDNKQQQVNAPDDEAKLSRALQKVDELLAKVDNKLSQGKDASIEEDELKKLKKQIEKLDKKVSKNFEQVEEHLKDKGMSEIILKRHYDMVKNYRLEMKTMMKNLDDLEVSEDKETKKKMAKKAHEHMKGKKHKRAHQPFDPNNLPHKAIKPNRENKPKKNKKEFHQAGLFSNPSVKVAALGNFTYDNLVGASDPAYLAGTDEVNLSDAIIAKAAELNHDPIQIYNFVRNNTEWLPTWGAMQDSDLTLGSLRGNAFDISSLLIALYRASGIPARYVHGTIDVPVDKFMNWAGGFTDPNVAANFASAGGIPIVDVITGGKITKFRIEHIWVEAAIDFQPSRGAKNKDADSWVAMDPSYKEYEYLPGLDVATISGVDANQLVDNFLNSGIINEAESYASGFDKTIIENGQAQILLDIENHVNTNLPNPTVGEVIGGRKKIVKELLVLPSGLSNKVKSIGAYYGYLPIQLQHQIKLGLDTGAFGEIIGGINYPWSKLNNEKVTLSFRPSTLDDEQALMSFLPAEDLADLKQLPSQFPSYLVNVTPELKVNGVVVLSGSSLRLGADVNFAYKIFMPNSNSNSNVIRSPVVAGSFLTFSIVGGGVSTNKLTLIQSKLELTRNRLLSNDPMQIDFVTVDDLLGDILHASSLAYFLQYIEISRIIEQKGQKVRFSLLPSAGTYGYEPRVDYLFGFPRRIYSGGFAMDMDRIAISVGVEGGQDVRRNAVIQMGILSSALESGISDQMFSTKQKFADAISAVKALQKAISLGQRIYHITAANQGQVLQKINHRQETLQEIRSALDVNKEVIVHSDPISIPGWSGAGYIIFDPITGAGAYKIGGGTNGKYLSAEEVKSIREKCDEDPSDGIVLGLLLGLVVGIGQLFDNIKNITKILAAIAAIASFAAEAMRTMWKIEEVATSPKNKLRAERIAYLGMALGAVAGGFALVSGGAGAAIVAIITLTAISSMINSFAVEVAAGCSRLDGREEPIP